MNERAAVAQRQESVKHRNLTWHGCSMGFIQLANCLSKNYSHYLLRLKYFVGYFSEKMPIYINFSKNDITFVSKEHSFAKHRAHYAEQQSKLLLSSNCGYWELC